MLKSIYIRRDVNKKGRLHTGPFYSYSRLVPIWSQKDFECMELRLNRGNGKKWI